MCLFLQIAYIFFTSDNVITLLLCLLRYYNIYMWMLWNRRKTCTICMFCRMVTEKFKHQMPFFVLLSCVLCLSLFSPWVFSTYFTLIHTTCHLTCLSVIILSLYRTDKHFHFLFTEKKTLFPHSLHINAIVSFFSNPLPSSLFPSTVLKPYRG